MAPEKFATDHWFVTVWVTDPLDKGTITRAAENVEVVYNHIRFKNGQPSPDEQAIQVAGAEEAPPETQPPDRAARWERQMPPGGGDLAVSR